MKNSNSYKGFDKILILGCIDMKSISSLVPHLKLPTIMHCGSLGVHGPEPISAPFCASRCIASAYWAIAASEYINLKDLLFILTSSLCNSVSFLWEESIRSDSVICIVVPLVTVL